MKRIKLFLLSAAIVAAGSAFTARPAPNSTEYVKDNGVWKVKSTVDGITGSCISLNNMHCTFVLRTGATQPYQDSDFTPVDSNQAWQNF